MTPAEIAELREFIAGELGKVHELTTRVDELHDAQLRFQKLVGRHFNDVSERFDRVDYRLGHLEVA